MEVKQTYKRLGVLAAAGIIVVLLGWLTRMNTENFEKMVVGYTLEHLQTIARTESQHIQRRMIDTYDELKVLAENPKVKDALVSGQMDKESLSVDAYSPEKIVYEHLMEDVSSLYRLDNKGIVQSRFPWKKGKAGDDYSLKPGIKMVLKDRRPYISDLFKTNSGKNCVSICVPVFEEEKFVGILRALIKLDVIQDCLKDSDIGSNGYAWMIDDNGTVVSHPESRYVGKNITTAMQEANASCDWAELREITKKMTEGENGTGFFRSISLRDEERKDIKKMTAFVPVIIANKQWSLGVMMEYDEVSGPVKIHSRNVTVGAVLSMLIVGGVVGWFYKIQKEKAKLVAEARSAEKLRTLNKHLTAANQQLQSQEQQLRASNQQLKYRLESEALLSEISARFIDVESGDIQSEMTKALERIGEFAGVDRSYIFQFHDDGRLVDNTYEWCAEGVEAQIDNLQNIDLEKEFPWFTEKLQNKGMFYIPDHYCPVNL